MRKALREKEREEKYKQTKFYLKFLFLFFGQNVLKFFP